MEIFRKYQKYLKALREFVAVAWQIFRSKMNLVPVILSREFKHKLTTLLRAFPTSWGCGGCGLSFAFCAATWGSSCRGVWAVVCISGGQGGDLWVERSGVWAVVYILGGPGGELGVHLLGI